ncbi:MAG: hypothetical protein HYY22_01725 [Thaumarchaeota archaeon]|nr:hypothetical protein [Nitrososphaerota archaeon]
MTTTAPAQTIISQITQTSRLPAEVTCAAVAVAIIAIVGAGSSTSNA